MLIAVAVGVVAVLLMRSSFGRTLHRPRRQPAWPPGSPACGSSAPDHAPSSSRACWPPSPAILIGGFGGLTVRVGDGLEFTAITAVVLGGVALGGGRGSVVGGDGRRATLEAVFRCSDSSSLADHLAADRAGRDHRRCRRLRQLAPARSGCRPGTGNPPTPGVTTCPQEDNDATSHHARGASRSRWPWSSPAPARPTIPTRPPTPAATTTEARADERRRRGARRSGEFFVQADYDRQLAQRDVEPEGDAESPGSRPSSRRRPTPPSSPSTARHPLLLQRRRCPTRGARPAGSPCSSRSRS